jgi:hypothetical protein
VGRIKESDKYEWHGVKCAGCGERQTIRLGIGTILTSDRFNDRHEYICPKCKKGKKDK